MAYNYDVGLGANIAGPNYANVLRTAIQQRTALSPIQRTFGINAPTLALPKPTTTVKPVVGTLPVLKTPVVKPTLTIAPTTKPKVTVPSFATQAAGSGGGGSFTSGGDAAPVAGESSAMASMFDFKKSPLPLILLGGLALYFVNKKTK